MVDRLVGRDTELAALTSMCQRVEHDRRAAAAIVVGDPGVGKSRLIAEMRTRAPGFTTLSVTGYEPERGVPMAAARDLLRRLADVPVDGEIIAGLVRGGVGPVPAPTIRVDDVRLFEMTYLAAARMMPVLVIVDDLQWVDPASAGLCHYLVRASAIGGRPLALIGCGRPSREVQSFTASLARVGGAQFLELRLGALDRAAGLEFIASRAPGLHRAAAEDLWRRAEGSPFWMERLLGNGGTADVDALMASHVGTLSADAESLIACLVAAGRPIDSEDVATALGWTEDRLAATTPGLLDAGLVAQTGGSLRIAHDLLREAASRQLSPRRLQRMHERLATLLESTAGDDIRGLLESLEHRQRAGMPTTGLALRLVHAPNRHLLEARGLERLAVIADGCAPTVPECRELRRAVARFADELGVHDEALVRWTAIAQTDDSPADAALAWLGASRAAVELGLRDGAWGYLERAAAASPSSDAFEAQLETQRSVILRSLDRSAEAAHDAADRAVRAARKLALAAGGERRMGADERRSYLLALQAASDAALMVDDPSAMLASADELVTVATGFDDRVRVRAMVSGALALRLGGRNGDAERRVTPAWNDARRLILPEAILEAGSLLGNVLLSLGRIEEAAAVSEECLALGGRLARFRPARAFNVVLPHLVELSRGDWHAASEGLSLAADREPDPHVRLHARLARASALARLDARRAEREVAIDVRRAIADAAESGCLRCRGEVLTRGSEALARVGRVDRSRHLARTARSVSRHMDRAMRMWDLRAAAMIAVASADPDARRLLEDTISEAVGQGLVLEALWGRLDLAGFLASRDREAAAQVARQAGEDAEMMGARTESRMAEQLLRSIGVRTWRRGRSGDRVGGLGALPDREREVARLAASGASNPEIAATLFLSRKTVERHLSNAFARLGVRNRAELAALMGGDEERLRDDPEV